MLPRPQGQADILKHLKAGRQFLVRVCERSQDLADRRAHGAGAAAQAGAPAAHAGSSSRAAFETDAGLSADAAFSADTDLPTDNRTAVEPVPIFRHHTAG
jgi:hypothetical protein